MVVFKRIIFCVAVLTAFFSFSQDEVTTINFTSGVYPLGVKVKIYYDKEWKPIKLKDSASFYRLISFKAKNIPLGSVEDFHIDDIKQNAFYASYVGLNVKGIDSVFHNGPSYFYHLNGNKKLDRVYINNVLQGEETWYYESGSISGQGVYSNGILEGEYLNFFESGKIDGITIYSNGKREGPSKRYYKSGELSSKSNYENGLREGKTTGFYKNGIVSYTASFKKNRGEGVQVFYYESGEIRGKLNYVNGQAQGEQIAFYETGELEIKRIFKDDLLNGEEITFYKSGNIRSKVNYENNLLQGERVFYYESGEVLSRINLIDNLKQGEQTYYLKSGVIDYTVLYQDDKKVDRRIALVIGNADYQKGPLENPINDAILIAESLNKLGFEVLLHKNLQSRNEMLEAIKDFGRKRTQYDTGFFYYAGHGIQLNNENYLLPVNEEFEYEDDVEDNGVSMQRLLRYLESSRENQLNFIVMDACRDNPFESNWSKTRSVKGSGLAKIPPPKGSLIAFSTDHGQTASDGDGKNSIYSKTLASKLLEENVSIEQVFKNVRTEVLILSNNTQSPVEESKLIGDAYYLIKNR